MTAKPSRPATPHAAVVGGGPVGFVSAILLARAGVKVTLFAPPSPPGDTRTSALLRGSVNLLDALGIWPVLRTRAEALASMRLIDDTARLVRAPTVTFHSSELGGGPFGYNIANQDLLAALEDCASRLDLVGIDRRKIVSVVPGADFASLECDDSGRLDACLVIGAEGRNSLCRKSAGISVAEEHFPQTALACNLTHEASHGNISTELHKSEGPLTFVPLPGRASSLVWVTSPGAARGLMALDDIGFAQRLGAESHSLLGAILSVGPRAAFPSTSILAKSMAGRRIALVGEAGHVMPPIGAQGLNLGLRDAAMLAEVVADHHDRAEDIGGAACLDDYAARRKLDVRSRSLAVNLLNRSVLGGFLPLGAARGAGLYLLERFGPLRRAVMDLGLMPPGDVPALMRDSA